MIIENYSSITAKLRKLLHKHAKWELNDKHKKSFEVLKNSLNSYCMLNYFDPKFNTEVICDASPHGFFVILTQYGNDENKKRVVAYASRSLTETEQRHSQIERESLAILFGYKVSSLSFRKTF